MEPPIEDVERVTRALGARPITWQTVPAHGSKANDRWVVGIGEGRTAFVKIARRDDAAAWLRDEHLLYSRLRARFMPTLLGWDDDEECPVLALEDLSADEWPPPWTSERVDAVLTTLEEVAGTRPPKGLPTVMDSQFDLDGWPSIAEDPRSFLELGLCSASWLDAALPALMAASRSADLGGESLLHLDVRSDNLCVRAERAMLVDWNWACIGNSAFDVAAWLPSLHAEGGPPPEAILPDGGGGFASLLAGYFCEHARRPPIPGVPHVRRLQLRQAGIALPWAARSLGLPPPS